MKHLKYEPDDLYPFVLLVLLTIEVSFVRWTMYFAVQYCYLDLEGLVDPNEWDQETIELCELAQHPLCKALFELAEQIHQISEELIEECEIDMEEYVKDDRIEQMANDFCNNFFFMFVPEKEEQSSVEIIVHCFFVTWAMCSLCEVVIKGEAYLTDEDMDDSLMEVYDRVWDHYANSYHPLHRVVGMVVAKSFDTHNSIVDLIM